MKLKNRLQTFETIPLTDKTNHVTKIFFASLAYLLTCSVNIFAFAEDFECNLNFQAYESPRIANCVFKIQRNKSLSLGDNCYKNPKIALDDIKYLRWQIIDDYLDALDRAKITVKKNSVGIEASITHPVVEKSASLSTGKLELPFTEGNPSEQIDINLENGMVASVSLNGTKLKLGLEGDTGYTYLEANCQSNEQHAQSNESLPNSRGIDVDLLKNFSNIDICQAALDINGNWEMIPPGSYFAEEAKNRGLLCK